MHRQLFATSLVIVALTLGCGKQHPEDKVTLVKEDDPEMNAAMANARTSIDTFIKALRSPKRSQKNFSVKKAFTEGRTTEYMWLSNVSFDGTTFHGRVNNEPDMVNNVKIGDEVTVERAGISDWMFIDNGKLVGGNTIRVLRDKMGPKDRAEFDKRVPFVID